MRGPYNPFFFRQKIGKKDAMFAYRYGVKQSLIFFVNRKTRQPAVVFKYPVFLPSLVKTGLKRHPDGACDFHQKFRLFHHLAQQRRGCVFTLCIVPPFYRI